jgi:hypothetical protein
MGQISIYISLWEEQGKPEQKDDAGVDKQYSSKTLFTDEKQKVASH